MSPSPPPVPPSRPPSTLHMLEAAFASNNHNRDLKFLCSGISLSYHQSILFNNSPLLSSLLGSLACCKCENGQCGRKEEVVIVLDKVEVGTVQGLMEYLYRGKCMVKDRRGFKEMQELVDMLGITIKLEIEDKFTNFVKVEIPDASEPNLEEAVTDFNVDIVSGANASENLNSVEDIEAEQTRLSEQVILCMKRFDTGVEETPCTECGLVIAKDALIEHYKTHVDQIRKNEFANIKKNKKKPGPKSKTMLKGIKAKKDNVEKFEAEDVADDPNVVGVDAKIMLPIASEVKKELVDEAADFPKSKRKSRKKNNDPKSSLINEDVSTDEYTCFNPTFKIKPGTKKVGKGAKSTVVVPVPEVKLTFNLDDLGVGIAPATIRLQDLSSTTLQVGRKRKSLSGDFPQVNKKGKVSNEKKTNAKKIEAPAGKKSNKASGTVMDETSPSSNSTSNSFIEVSKEVSTISNSIFSLPSTRCPSFSSFLRTVCDKADLMLPPGPDREQGRRVVHRLAGQSVQRGGDTEVTNEEVMREMMEEIEEEEVSGNISSDGSESALVMDLSDQDL